jgi:hypothetical protein
MTRAGRYNAAYKALAEAKRVDPTKEIREGPRSQPQQPESPRTAT